jgi:hypothetical protein
VFTPGRLRVMDRDYPGVLRIKALPETGTHVLIRVRDGITLHRHGEFLPDGSYLASITGSGATLTVRVIEYHIRVAGRDAAELFCLITDLHDHQAYPAQMLAAAYHWRWAGSETTLKEAKSAISGAGPSTAAMLRSGSPALVAQEHAAWVIATELARTHRPRGRRGRGSRRQGPPRRPARAAPGDLVHRRPPRRHRRHPLRHCHRQPPRRADPHLPRSCARRPGTPPRRHRPRPAPRSENQGPARLPARRAAPSHSQGSRRDQPLRADRRLTRPFPAIPADPWNRPPTRSTNPGPAAALTHRDRHNEYPYSSTPRTQSPRPR